MILHPKLEKSGYMRHGPKGGDEVTSLKKAANYGWLFCLWRV
jgi:glucose/arabinose dehydrogenase